MKFLKKSGWARDLAKTLSWRIVATTDTILIARVISGSWSVGLGIAGIEVVTKMALYYFHERGWSVLSPVDVTALTVS